MRVVAIIQARMGSTRLPGKTLLDIAGQPLLGHVIDRVRASKCVTQVAIATTEDPVDLAIVAFCDSRGVATYRGSRMDVLDRFYRVACLTAADVIVRITADDPFKDPDVIDLVAGRLLAEADLDYASNTLDPTFPEGLDVEAFTFSALERAWREAGLASEREHVTPYIWKRPDRFRLANVACGRNLSNLRWTLDYEEDLRFAREVYSRLYRGQVFRMPEILELIASEPALAAINSGIGRNAGYLASLDNDKASTTPVMKTVPRISSLERRYALEVLDAQFATSSGSFMTKRLEEAFARKFDCGYAVSFANGTATMHAALAAAGVGPGDEVIVPPLTMASTAFCVLHCGAIPVFADVHPETWTLDPGSVLERITPRTKAVIPVSLYGLPPDMAPIMELALRHKLFVLEDAAQCFLGSYHGRIVGSIGNASSFSFQSSKHMTCGEGGMITTNDEELATQVRRMGSLGYAAVSGAAGKSKITRDIIQDPRYLRHSSVGWNYRLSDLCAAVLLGQLERLDELVQVRVDSARAFARALDGCTWLVPQSIPSGYVHSYWTLACRLTDEVTFSWHDFRRKYLEFGGDGFYAAWALTYLEPVFRNRRLSPLQTQAYTAGLCPVAEKLQPYLLQFKTNYFDPVRREKAAEALARTVAFFQGAG